MPSAVVYGKSTRERRGVCGANGRSREGREQQKFSMDALKLLGNILKDVANAKE